MSKLSVIGILLIIALFSVFYFRKYNRTTIMGTGNVTKEERAVTGFSKLVLNGVFKTVISQDGGPASVRVETDQNLQKTVEVKNEGETLEISTKEGFNFNNPSKMVVYVNVKDLSSISNKSIGAVESDGTIKATDLYLKDDAVGKMNLSLDVQKLTAVLNAVGTTTLTGSATVADFDNNSVGKLSAEDLKVDTLTIKNNAVGKVEVYAEKEISIDHNGVGTLHYHGPATVTRLKDNGVGKVSKAD